MSWLEIGLWVLMGITGVVYSLAFGHALGAPMRMQKWLLDNPAPRPPSITSYPSNKSGVEE